MRDAFGWKTSWISVKDTRMELIVDTLRLVHVRSCDWNEGVQQSGKGGIFVSPAVERVDPDRGHYLAGCGERRLSANNRAAK